MKRCAVALAAVLIAAPAFAAHPRGLMTASIISRIQAKAASGTNAEWLALRGSASTPGTSCDRITQTTATGDTLPPVYASREPVTSSTPGYVTAGYQGDEYFKDLLNLGVCYYALKDSDATQAARYSTQAVKIIRAASSPAARLAPASPPASWNGLTARDIWYVTNDGPSGQARVHIYNHGLSTGASVTVSGVLGCTTANVTGQVGTTASTYFDLADSGGSPVICNAAGTNYNHNWLSDATYPVRFFVPALAIGYDWFYSFLSADDKTQVYDAINGALDDATNYYWYTGAGNSGNPYAQRTQSNYHVSYFNALGLAGIMTRGENPRGQAWYDFWSQDIWTDIDKPFYQNWLGNHGGFWEALRYQTSIATLGMTMLADYDANGTDRMGSEFPWLLELPRYWMHNTTPPRAQWTERNFSPSPADATGTNPFPWQNDMMWVIHHIMDLKSDAARPQFKRYVDDLTALTNPSQLYPFNKVLFWDSSLSSSDWTAAEPLSLPQMSSPTGGYQHATMRSDWGTGAVFADYAGGTFTSCAYNGKELYDKGSLFVQRGGVGLLVSAKAECTRANDLACYNKFHADTGGLEKLHYSAFYTVRDSDSRPTLQALVAGMPGRDMPWYAPVGSSTGFAAKIDRYDEATSYAYMRSVNLSANYRADGTYSTHFPTAGWDREILYLRPKVFVVYDRTRKANKTTSPTVSYSQHMKWVVGKTPTVSAYGSSMQRAEVSDGGTFKGGVTSVLPASNTMTAVDANSFGIVYDLEVRPAAEAEYVNWLTVVDAADSSGGLDAVAKFTSSNADVIRLGSSTVVGFASYQNGASVSLPMTYTVSGLSGTTTHRIAGLSASATYNVSVSGSDVTIAASGAGSDYTSSAAGVLEFTTGAGGTLPVLVGTSALSSGSDGVAYSQTLSASGGIGAPFTWSKTVGNLPAGLSLSSGGVLSGTPTTAESQTFTVQACDADTPTPSCGTKQLTLVIAANPPVLSGTLPGGIIGQAYSTTVTRTGGVGSVSYAVTSGSLCTGLSLTGATGVVSGTPTTAQVCSFRITATDSDTPANTGYRDYSVTIASSPYEVTVNVAPGSTEAVIGFSTKGLPYSASCVVTIKDGEFAIATATSATGTASRVVSVSGLSPETSYGAVVNCEWLSPQAIQTFTTRAAGGGGSAYSLKLKPAASIFARLTALDATLATAKANLYWQASGAGSYTATKTVCGSGCLVTKSSLPAGVYQYYLAWESNGTEVASSAGRPAYIAVP